MGAEARPPRLTARKAKKSAARPSKPSRPKPSARPAPKARPKPLVKVAPKAPPKPAPKKAAVAPKSDAAPAAAEAILRPDARRHVLSLAFIRDGDEFLARLETDGGQITELKNRSLDQLLTLVAGELEDLLE